VLVNKDLDTVDQRLLIDVRELSKLTGLAIGTIYHLISEGRLPVIRLSARCVRFRPSDIDRWISQHVVEAKTGK
jgi:excisionase family DNA binding protein